MFYFYNYYYQVKLTKGLSSGTCNLQCLLKEKYPAVTEKNIPTAN